MNRKFITSLALILLLNLLVKPFFIFFIDPTVQNRVGPESYGFYFSLFSFTWVLNILLDFGIEKYNNTEIARHHHLLDKYLSNLFGLKIMLGVIYFTVLFTVGIIMGYTTEQLKMLGLLACNMFIFNFILYLRSNINGLHLFKTDSILSVLDRAILIIVLTILLWVPVFKDSFTIRWFVFAQTFSYIITFLIALVILLRKTTDFKIKFNLNYSLALLKQSLPYALLIFLMASYKYFDSVAIERILGNSLGKIQTGIYAQSFRLMEGVSQFAFLFAVLLLPLFSRMIQKKESIEGLTAISSVLLFVPIIGVAFSGWYFRTEIIELFYHKIEFGSNQIFGLLMIGLFFISMSFIFGTLLTANGNLKTLNILAGITVLINISLNLILVPRYMAIGAAISHAVSQGFMAISQFIYALVKFRFRINYKLIFKIISYIAILPFITYSLKFLDMEWYFKFILIFIGGMVYSLAIQLINVRQYITILNLPKEN